MEPFNVVALAGRVVRPAEERVLASGERLVSYEVAVRPEGEAASTLTVVLTDPPDSASQHAVETEVVVVGSVRRRFFRSGGVTQARTEVVANAFVPARNRKRVRSALESVCLRLEDV